MKRNVLSHAKWWATQWPYPQSERGWRVLVVLLTVFIVALVGTTIIWATVAGNLRLVLFTVAATLIALIALGVVPMLNLVGRRRSRVLQRRFLSDLVVTAYCSQSIIDWLHRQNYVGLASSSADMTVSIVFNELGASLWRGVLRPELAGDFRWSSIRAVEARGDIRRGVEIGEIVFSFNDQGDGSIGCSLLPLRPWGMSVPKQDELLTLVGRLRQLLDQSAEPADT